MTAIRDARDAPAAAQSWPFAPIEELDCYLESPWEPDLVQVEIHAPGHLDRVTLGAALADALDADPAARRHLVAASRRSSRLRWAAAPPGSGPADAADAGLLIVAGWSGPGELAELRAQLSALMIDLASGAIRLVLAVGPEHDVVILQTHHAAFDGMSSLALLAAICAAYRDRAGVITRPPAPSAPALSAPALSAPALSAPALSAPALSAPAPSAPAPPGSAPADPAPAGLAPWPGSPREQATFGRPEGSRPALPGRVARIAPRATQPGRPGYGFVLASVPVPRAARSGDGPHPTVNDLMVAAMIRTIEAWNAAHHGAGGTIRITVPVNNRDPEQRWTGSGNQTRLIRVTAHPGRPAGLLEQVAAQTRAAKGEPRPGLDGLSRLLAAPWAPTAVKRRATRLARRVGSPLLTDTSMVTNLGLLPDPPSFSGSGAEPLWFYGPAAMPRGLAVGAVTVAGQLNLCVSYRHALLGAAAAADFARAYCQTLASLAAPPEDRSV
jgi:hypothetical protein